MLLANAAKPAREQLTFIGIYEELRGAGYGGGYDAVRRYALGWREEHGAATAEAFVPLSFAPGEAYQFDWSHEVLLLKGITVTVKVAHVRLCHSRMTRGTEPPEQGRKSAPSAVSGKRTTTMPRPSPPGRWCTDRSAG
jgi:hypothetical protein